MFELAHSPETRLLRELLRNLLECTRPDEMRIDLRANSCLQVVSQAVCLITYAILPYVVAGMCGAPLQLEEFLRRLHHIICDERDDVTCCCVFNHFAVQAEIISD